jgi:hypothetical protein
MQNPEGAPLSPLSERRNFAPGSKGPGLPHPFPNLCHPAPSRSGNAYLSLSDVADHGGVHLAPEFWPDFRDRVSPRHHPNRCSVG